MKYHQLTKTEDMQKGDIRIDKTIDEECVQLQLSNEKAISVSKRIGIEIHIMFDISAKGAGFVGRKVSE